MKRINYTSAPLPFMGQKRRWNREFKSAIKQFNDCDLFVDLFGGSGLLSHMVKSVLPDARVIYNDFDDYHVRILNVGKTNLLLGELRELLRDAPTDKKINEPLRSQVLDIIKKAELSGYVDYITLSSSLLFSMNYASNFDQLEKQTLYNTIRQSDYCADNYLDGLEIVKKDYQELFELYRGFPKVVFLIDPPYLSTEAGTYNGYWKLGNYLDVLHTLNDTNYFYFTSNKSHIIELCDWMQRNLKANNPFDGAVKHEIVSNINYSSKYVDIMMYKHK